jgi:hypothetical protein
MFKCMYVSNIDLEIGRPTYQCKLPLLSIHAHLCHSLTMSHTHDWHSPSPTSHPVDDTTASHRAHDVMATPTSCSDDVTQEAATAEAVEGDEERGRQVLTRHEGSEVSERQPEGAAIIQQSDRGGSSRKAFKHHFFIEN